MLVASGFTTVNGGRQCCLGWCGNPYFFWPLWDVVKFDDGSIGMC